MRRKLGLEGGVLVCAPLPAEVALRNEEVEDAINRALADAATQGVKGRAVTPFLLSALARATQGRSLTANRALLENNAGIAAEISRAVSPPQYV
jgi:pseudouridine-5'-phosphate glycosidase